MPLSQHDHVIQALASDGAHQPLRQRILPSALRCRQDFGGAQVSEAIAETFPIDLVPISDQISWRRVFGERFQDLLSGPSRRRMFRHVEMHDAPTMMRQHYQDKQHLERGRRHGEEIDREQIL